MRTISLAVVFSLALAIPMAAQGTAATIKVDQQFVLQQFGDQFTLVTSVPVSVGDLDGDGVEDIVIPARCKNPMIDQAAHNFRVVDPYYDFFGYGDPKITTTFSEGNPALRGLVALVINGAGPDAWRSATPKSKFVIVNLPFKGLSVRKMQLNKKRMIEAIYVEEAGDMGESSAVFFDGKKFRYVPMGGDMQ
ncbi:MAG: hypothetical protein ABSD39_08150 [Terriglobales bacterium]|jgi:hypothetical protein